MALTEQQLENADLDIRFISDIATLAGGTATNRLGATRKVLAQVLAEIESAGDSIGSLNPEFLTAKVAGGVPNSPYLGGVDSKFSVGGLVAFAKTTNGGEHRLINYWDGNNSVSIQNLSNSDAYSAIRFLDYQGREAMAVGYGNPGTIADLPFAGAGYIETSSFINADGSPNNGIPPRPIRMVSTGYMTRRDGSQAQGVYGRVSIEADGSFNFYHLDPRWSFARPMVTFTDTPGMYFGYFWDHDDNQNGNARQKVVMRLRRQNYDPTHTYNRGGVVIGQTYEGSPQTGGVPPPQVALDVGGTILAGFNFSIDRSQGYTAPSGNDFPFCSVNGAEEQLRMFRTGVGKADFLFQMGGPRGVSLALADPDNGNGVPFAVSLNGKKNIFLTGSGDAAGGSGVVAIANATVEPTDNPAGGGVLYFLNGVLKVATPTGIKTVTVA